jgi:glucosamine--fructose-6-phosphate aminotransferase (isomerizing)
MPVDIKQEIMDIPRALREMLEKGRPEYETLVRNTRWGDGPIYLTGSGSSIPAALTGAYALESLSGWPVVARPAAGFAAYSAAVLRPRSVVLAISGGEECEEVLAAARTAKSRGAILLVLAENPDDPLARIADGVFRLRLGKEVERGFKRVVLQQAGLSYIALLAARILKRPHPQFDALQQEFEKLPGQVEWVLNQLPDAVRSLASELNRLRNLDVLGEGFYHPAALQGAFWLRRLAEVPAVGSELSEFSYGAAGKLDGDSAVLILSGAGCRLKKQVHEVAQRLKTAGARILCITDSNDRELIARAALALLLPTMSEMVGSVLTLALVGWVAYQAARERDGAAPGSRTDRKTRKQPEQDG